MIVSDRGITTTVSNYKSILKNIRTDSVRDSNNNLEVNKVLNEAPPAVDKMEKKLPRRSRSLLTQLRSGYSSMLNSYLSVVDETIEDKCPKCFQISHTTEHLFNCPADPTDLTMKSLWTDPLAAAQFLGLDPGLPSDDNG